MNALRLDPRDREVLLLWLAFLVAMWTLAGVVGWLGPQLGG